MKKPQIVKTTMAVALMAAFSFPAFAQQPGAMAINGNVPATVATPAVGAPAAPTVATAEATPAAQKKEATNPFTGRSYGNESLQRELDTLRLNNQLQQERLKQRRDEMELFRLEQEALKFMKQYGVSAPAPAVAGAATPAPVTPQSQPAASPAPAPAVSAPVPAPAPKKTSSNRLSLKEMAALERANAPKYVAPKEPVKYFTPPADKNIAEPVLVGIVQKDNLKTAILNYNNVTVRVPEGGTIAGQSITGVGNGKVMWGNKALFSTGFVEGPRIERTDYEIPAQGAPVNYANAIKILQESDMAKKAYKAGVGLNKNGVQAQQQRPSGGQIVNTNANNSAVNRLPPPPPVSK